MNLQEFLDKKIPSTIERLQFDLPNLRNHLPEKLLQKQIGKIIGFPQSRISEWEHNPENMKIKNLIKFAEAAGFTVKISFNPKSIE